MAQHKSLEKCKPLRCHPRIHRSIHNTCNLSLISVVLLLLTLFGQTLGMTWRDGFRGDGTTHEALGQEHFPPAELTPYKSTVHYTIDKPHSWKAMHPVFNITHWFFDRTIRGDPALPTGYITVKNGDTLALGPKAEENDWSELMAMYWFTLLWIFFLLFLIIVMPFVAVCYFCFCCCRRCTPGCPPCTQARDMRRNLIYSVVLIVLIILMLLGIAIAFVSSRILDHGIDETKDSMRRGSEDTCRFLRDIGDHIQHIFIYNYEEMQAHLIDTLNEAHNHIFVDLGDTSESNAIEELERILDNMPEALRIMKQVDKMEKELRYLGAQMRDGVRGMKRDVNYACAVLISHNACHNFLQNSGIQFVDASPCLHLDLVPNTQKYTLAIAKIIKDEVALIPKKALERYQDIGKKIAVAMQQVIPPMIRDVTRGAELFDAQALKLKNIIDSVISDIHFKTLRSTKSFEDVYDKFGLDRSVVTILACALVLVIVLILIAALLISIFGNKGTAASCLLIAIVMVFCVFSFITLLGVFYFMLGLITYQGVCAPLRDQSENALFRQVDAAIDLNRYLPGNEGNEPGGVPALRMSTAIKECQADQSIFELLHLNNLYDVESLRQIKVMTEPEEGSKTTIFDEDLSKVFLLTEKEKIVLTEMKNGNLSDYHSVMYTEHLCETITPNLPTIANQMRALRDSIYHVDENWNYWNRFGRYSLTNEAYHTDLYHYEWTDAILRNIRGLKKTLEKVDSLITYENRQFGDSINVLLEAIIRSEKFIKEKGNDFINNLGENLTIVVMQQIDEYIQGLMDECQNNIGHCRPLAYIYYRGVDLICYRLVDPLNGFWFGILMCALLMLPLLFVCHRLMCVWKIMHHHMLAGAAVAAMAPPPPGGCPTCTGAPYQAKPVIACGGGQQTFCVCTESKRTDGGAANNVPDTTDTVQDSVGPSKRSVEEDEHQADNRANVGQQQQLPKSSSLAKGKIAPPTPAKANKRKKD